MGGVTRIYQTPFSLGSWDYLAGIPIHENPTR